MWRACWPRACFAQPDHRPPLEASHTMKLDYHDLANRLASPSRQRAQGRDNIPACATCQPSNGLVGEPLNPALRTEVTLVPSSRPHQTGPIGSPCIAGALRRNVGGLSLTSTPNVIYRTPTAKTAHAGSARKPRPQLQHLAQRRCKIAIISASPKDERVQLFAFDDSYLELLRAGDFRTQQHFVSYFSELMHLKLRSRLRSEQAIEDVRQETFTRVFAALRSGGGLREPARLGAFVNSTCNNVLLESYRSSSRNTSLEEEDSNHLPDRGVDALSALIQKQAADNVRRVIDDLPERDRRLLKEVFLEERNKDEVCDEFGVDRNYLRVLLHRAKRNFRALYLKTVISVGQTSGK